MKTLQELTEAIASAALAFSDSKRSAPADAMALSVVEDRFNLKLPADVRAFYSRVDGTDMMDGSHGLITLWPLERWAYLDDEAPECAKRVPGDAIVFADHSLWCWAYAAQFERGSERTTVHIVGAASDGPIAETFTEFLELILADSPRLYGMSNREDPLQVSGDIVNTRPSGTRPR